MRAHLRSLTLLASVLLFAACPKAEDEQADSKKRDTKKDDGEKRADDKRPDDKKPDEKQADKPAQPQPGGLLTLGDAKIVPKDKPDEGIEITADGTIKMLGKPDETIEISPEGKLSKADGTLIAEVGSDGALMVDGKPSGISVTETGVSIATPDGKTMKIGFLEDGTIVMSPKPEAELPAMTVEGCTGPVARTCALVLAMFVFMASEPSGGPAAVEAPPSE